MKTLNWIYIILFGGLLLFSCKNVHRNHYAITDFKESLQPSLREIVSKGWLEWSNAEHALDKEATDKDLMQLSRAEHPVLRGFAFRAMLKRPTIDHFKLLMNNLDDSAMITVYNGEFELGFVTVSDDFIENSKWKNRQAKQKTIDEIIMHHNYLKSAYTKIYRIEPLEKYYPSVLQMTRRQGRKFEETEKALYALAKFKKKKDLPFIKEILLSHLVNLSSTSFNLLESFPDKTYEEVYRKYYQLYFYSTICNGQTPWNAGSYIYSIASCKNEQSAKILDSILNRKPFMPCFTDTSFLKEELIDAIWTNQCPLYSEMIMQVKSQVKSAGYFRSDFLNPNWVEVNKDESSELIRWW